MLSRSAVVLAVLGAACTASDPPDPGTGSPTVIVEVHHDTSPSLRDLAVPVRRPSHAWPARALPRPSPLGGETAPVQPEHPPLPLIPANLVNVAGVGNGFTGPSGTFTVTSAPPDPAGDVGPNHYVQVVNSDLAVFSKDGTPIYGPVPTNTLWSGFGGGCETNNDGDGTVLYDPIADRWVIAQFSVTTTPYLECVAVSATADPTGAWHRYSFSYGNSDFPDYPKMGVWPDAYYETFNIFTNASTFAGARACAYDRLAMLAGSAATQVCFNTTQDVGGLLPADLDGARLPPAGAPNYLVALGASPNQLATYTFHVDFGSPGNSALTGPLNLNVASFSEACNGGTCIPQSGTTVQLDSLADRVMYRLAYRNFGDHESLVVTHAITAGTSTGIRWYELRLASGVLSVFQQGTYAPDTSYRWMSSAAMDGSGDIALGFSVSSSLLHPEIHYTGRLAGDPAGTMTQGEGTIIDGAGSQTGSFGLTRWGDYSMMTVDPSDDCTFWYTNEYIPANGSFNWATRIASFRFPSCGTTVPDDFSVSASPSALTANQGGTATTTIDTAVTSGNPQTVALSIQSISPAGDITGSFVPTSITAGGSSTLTLTVGAAATPGSYTITILGTGTSATHTTTVTLTVSATGVVNGGFETGDFTGWTTAGMTAIVSAARSGAFAAQLGQLRNSSGDSTIAQTFTAPVAGGTLTFWYHLTCRKAGRRQWATATVRDNTTGVTTTMLAPTCTHDDVWHPVTATVAAGDSLTLTIVSHDGSTGGQGTELVVDDVAVLP